jgi:exonuclease SbcC
MKLKLTNFLCHENYEVDLGENGISLLSGNSGSGKTSILKAIFFALFGEGTKLTMYGKTSCSVEIEFDNLKVIRTKRPNRLLVNDTYEDATGQEIIDNKFGHTFKTSGYIQQNNLSSFMLMSPIDKLEFLEKFSFKDVNIGKIKHNTKLYIQKRNEELISIDAQLTIAKSLLQEISIPKEVIFPISYKKKSQITKIIKNEGIKHKNLQILCKKAEKRCKQTEKELNNTKILEASISSKIDSVKEISKTIDKLNDTIISTNYIGDEKLNEYKEEFKKCLEYRELSELHNIKSKNDIQLVEMKKKEIESLEKEINNLETSLWSEYSKEEIMTIINELKTCLNNVERTQKLYRELEEIDITDISKKQDKISKFNELLIEKEKIFNYINLQNNMYDCPCCKANLKLVDNNLEIFKGDSIIKTNLNEDMDLENLKSEIKILKENITKLNKLIIIDESNKERSIIIKKEIDTINNLYEDKIIKNDIVQDLEYLREYKSTQKILENRLGEFKSNIVSNTYSSSYISFNNNNIKIIEQIKKLEKSSSKPKYEEDFLRNIIYEQSIFEQRLKDLKIELNKLNYQKITISNNINKQKEVHLNIYGEIREVDSLVDFLENTELELNNLYNKIKYQNNVLESINIWEEYNKEQTVYNNFKLKILKIENDEIKVRSEYAASTKLRDKILEAESLAMSNIIDSINQHANIYLESFFQNDPITVTLHAFKEGKDCIKPKINVNVEYKGMDTDLSPLSGGELSRVVLAYTLALAEMFNTPLLMLDECTSNLDQDLSGVVFDAIRENFNGKHTIVIAHQVIEGTFDKILKIGV